MHQPTRTTKDDVRPEAGNWTADTKTRRGTFFITQQLVVQESGSRNILKVAVNSLQNIYELKGLRLKVSQDVISLQVTLSNAFLNRPPGHIRGQSVILEDSLGRHLEIPGPVDRLFGVAGKSTCNNC